MNQKTVITIYVILMSVLAATWIYLESQVTVTRTCYEFDKEIPCEVYELKQQQFLPSAPANWTLTLPPP